MTDDSVRVLLVDPSKRVIRRVEISPSIGALGEVLGSQRITAEVNLNLGQPAYLCVNVRGSGDSELNNPEPGTMIAGSGPYAGLIVIAGVAEDGALTHFDYEPADIADLVQFSGCS